MPGCSLPEAVNPSPITKIGWKYSKPRFFEYLTRGGEGGAANKRSQEQFEG
jgi:hypothetical protein